MAQTRWLTLTDYSNKYKVSISTLRRRIKNGQVENIYEDGKYFLKDASLDRHQNIASPLPAAPGLRETMPPQPTPRTLSQQERPRPFVKDSVAPPPAHDGGRVETEKSSEPVLATVNQLLAEIKKAYMTILQEKEEQILLLKDEVADLKTLVRVLEAENDRITANSKEAAPIDSWLDELNTVEK